MPAVSGTSTDTRQTTVGYGGITAPYFEVLFPSFPSANVLRVGTYYVMIRPAGTNTQRRVLQKGALYLPGQLIQFTNFYLFTGVLYALEVDWNNPGLAWTINYA